MVHWLNSNVCLDSRFPLRGVLNKILPTTTWHNVPIIYVTRIQKMHMLYVKMYLQNSWSSAWVVCWTQCQALYLRVIVPCRDLALWIGILWFLSVGPVVQTADLYLPVTDLSISGIVRLQYVTLLKVFFLWDKISTFVMKLLLIQMFLNQRSTEVEMSSQDKCLHTMAVTVLPE